nr:GPP34 family phosphoprotein [Tahibacter caeni]
MIAERFVLLALDPRTGRLALPRRDTSADLLCAAGLLIDLLLQQRLAIDASQRWQTDTSLPSSNTLLSAAAAALSSTPPPAADDALRRVERRLAPLAGKLLEGLYRRDFLHRQRDWRFWRADALHYPLRSLQARNDAVQFLQQACDGGSAAGLGLLLLADLAGVMTAHLDARHHERANRLLLGLNSVDAHSELYGLALLRNALLA